MQLGDDARVAAAAAGAVAPLVELLKPTTSAALDGLHRAAAGAVATLALAPSNQTLLARAGGFHYIISIFRRMWS